MPHPVPLLLSLILLCLEVGDEALDVVKFLDLCCLPSVVTGLFAFLRVCVDALKCALLLVESIDQIANYTVEISLISLIFSHSIMKRLACFEVDGYRRRLIARAHVLKFNVMINSSDLIEVLTHTSLSLVVCLLLLTETVIVLVKLTSHHSIFIFKQLLIAYFTF